MIKRIINILNPSKSQPKTLKSLAQEGHTYWKFSQSKAGQSQEKNVFAEYIENEITTALDVDKALSFTTEMNIVKCFMYGDQLTKLCFSKKNPKFRKIMNNTYHYIGCGLGEYETRQLVAEKNYSLKDKSTIRLLVELMPEKMNLYETGWFRSRNPFEERLRDFGFRESADLLKEIKSNLDDNMYLTKDEVLNIIDNYMEY